MGNPLKLIRTGNVSVDVQEMSNNDMDYITHLVLRKVALESDLSTGALNVSGVGTTVGSFSDTARIEAIGQREATGAFVTTTTTLSQNLQSVSETTVLPLELINKQPKPISSANLDSNIISYISSNLANTSTPSISQYYLSTVNPTSSFSGTWVQVATLQDAFGGSSGVSSNTTTLWKKTNDTLPPIIRPLKLGANGTIQEMSDVEIETLTDRYRNRIIQTGIGKYSLSTYPPLAGTWVQVGNTFLDTRQQVAANSYIGVFAGTYARAYTGQFTGTFSRQFSRVFTGNFARSYSKAYSGSYARSYTGIYQGLVQKNYSRAFVRTRNVNFTKTYTRVTKSGNFSRNQLIYYNNFGRYVVTGYFFGAYQTGYNRAYTRGYVGYYTGTFTGLYSRNYAGTYTRLYTGLYTKLYTRLYTGQYTGQFTGSFTGAFNRNFTRHYTGNYTGSYTSDTVSSNKQTISTIALWLRVA